MSRFFDGVHEIARDHARDDLYEHVRTLGVPAELAPRGDPAESVLRGPSLGLVMIPPPHGLIRSVNVRRVINGDQDDYFTDYAVPDSRLSGLDTSRLEITSAATGGFWPFRDPTGVEWRGNDLNLGILQRLNDDSSLAEHLLRRLFPRRPISIKAHQQSELWTITVPGGDTNLFNVLLPRLDLPSPDQWHCYQHIARHLVGTSLSS